MTTTATHDYTPVVVCDDRLAMVQGIHLISGKGLGITPSDPAACSVCIEQLANAIACTLENGVLVPRYSLDALHNLSDDNPSVCRVIRALRIAVNDRCPDALRDELLWPTLMPAFNTRGSRALTERRMFRVMDWTIREILPLAFDAAKLAAEANELRALIAITDAGTARSANKVVQRVRKAADADADAAAAAYADADAYSAADAYKYAAAYAATAAATATDAYSDAAAYAAADADADADADAYSAAATATAAATDAAAYAAADADADAATYAARANVWRKVMPLLLELCAMQEEPERTHE